MLAEIMADPWALVAICQIINAIGFGAFAMRDWRRAKDYPSYLTTADKEGWASLFCLTSGLALLGWLYIRWGLSC